MQKRGVHAQPIVLFSYLVKAFFTIYGSNSLLYAVSTMLHSKTTDPFIEALADFFRENPEFTPAGVSVAAGLNNAAIRHMLSGKSKSPKIDTALRICEVIGKSLPEMLGVAASGVPSIPRYDAKLAAGLGCFNSEHAEIIDYIPFTGSFIKQKLRRSTTEGLICCDAKGDSMEPVIADGDLLIVDLRQTERSAGIYAVNYGEESFVKRVEKLANGYSLVSENRAYPPIFVKGDEVNALNIIGSVLWAGRVF